MAAPSSIRDAIERTLSHARETDVLFTAAGIAYYMLVSLIPTVVLGFALVSELYGPTLAVELVESSSDVLSPAAQRTLEQAVLQGTGRLEATVGSTVVFLWGVLRVFRGVRAAFSTTYDSDRNTTILSSLRDSVVTLFAVSLGLVLLVGLGIILESAGITVHRVLLAFAQLALLALVLFPLYYVLPGVNVDVREATPGSVVAAGGLVVLLLGFQAYIELATGYPVYGALGGVLVLVTWLYFASFLLLAGAVVNVVLAGRD